MGPSIFDPVTGQDGFHSLFNSLLGEESNLLIVERLFQKDGSRIKPRCQRIYLLERPRK